MASQPADQPGIKGQTLPVARSGTAGDGGAEGMARVLHCECGCVARGATDHAVLDDVMAHLGAVHPELVGKVTRQDQLGWIQIEP